MPRNRLRHPHRIGHEHHVAALCALGEMFYGGPPI
jgi:hypothetical protein